MQVQESEIETYLSDKNVIRCIFFSEFHHIAGPKITCQVSLILFSHTINILLLNYTFEYVYMDINIILFV